MENENTQTPEKKPTIFDLADKKVAEIEQKRKDLEKCLQEIEHKKQLCVNREKFIVAQQEFDKAETLLKAAEDFESQVYTIKFYIYNEHREERVFTINNRFILLKFTQFIKGEIVSKIRELEDELIK